MVRELEPSSALLKAIFSSIRTILGSPDMYAIGHPIGKC